MRLTGRLSFRARRAVRVLLLGLLVAGLVLAARLGGLLQPLELAAQDRLVAHHAGNAQSPRLLLVLASEDDIARLGWPLSDQVLAGTVQRLHALGARAIGIDIYRDRPVGLGADQLDRVQDVHDSLYWVFRLGDGDQPGVAPPARLAGTPRAVLADLVVDAGGVARRGLLVAADPATGANVRTLGTALAEHAAGTRLSVDGDGLAFGAGRIALVEAGRGAYARIDDRGYQMLLDFAGGPAAFPQVSLGALLAGEVPAGLVQGRAVLVGTGAVSVRDRFPTPVSAGDMDAMLMPGVAVHAHLADQLLRIAAGEARTARPTPRAADALMLAAAGLAMAAAALAGAWVLLPALVAALALVPLAAALGYPQGLLLPAVPLALTLCAAAAASAWLLFGLGAADRRRLRDGFAHYLDPRVIRELAESDTPPSFRGERREITALFTDLEAFTHLAETLEPADLGALMNRYFDGIARAVTAHGGLLAQFTGDGVVALFGAPQAEPRHAARAVEAALAIDAFAQGFAAQRRAERIAWGATRIGIATGPALVGHLGTEARLHYGAVGDVLVTASRLEGLNRMLGTRIAVAGETARAAG